MKNAAATEQSTERVRPFSDGRVAAAFAEFPEEVADRLMRIRELIFEVAAAEDVGALEETLRWGQPAYITSESRSGSLIRLGRVKSDGDYGVFFHCGTTLVESMRERYPDEFRFQGNRALLFDASEDVPKTELAECFRLALTYHRRPRKS